MPPRSLGPRTVLLLVVSLLPVPPTMAEPAPRTAARRPVTLRAAGVETGEAYNVTGWAVREIHQRFVQRHPHIRLVPSVGLRIPGRTDDIAPLMQIAGDIPPEVMAVDFRKSHTYIRNRFLYPLDKFVEAYAGLQIPDDHLLDLPAYLKRLTAAPNYERLLSWRVPHASWQAMRRRCPYRADCAHLRQWSKPPADVHYHIWCFPLNRQVQVLQYDRGLFAEAGLPDRAPTDLDEMLRWARRLTNPRGRPRHYGLALTMDNLGFGTLSILYSFGGRLLEQDDQGNWHCVFDRDEAVDAYHFVARLFLEPFENEHGRFTGVVAAAAEGYAVALAQPAMHFTEMYDTSIYRYLNWSQWGFGPVPASGRGTRGTPVNAGMLGIYAGLAGDPAKLEAAWHFIEYVGGTEAEITIARKYVEAGYARCVRPRLLRAAGYEQFLNTIPDQWNQSLQRATESAVAEPYGKNAQMVYRYVHKAIEQIRTDDQVAEAIARGDEQSAKSRIRQILRKRVAAANEKMLGVSGARPQGVRRWTAIAVAAAIVVVFVLVLYKVRRTYKHSGTRAVEHGRWQLGRYKWAYLLMLPALITIGMWAYYPLARGSVMAFQEYNVRGTSRWVGMENFAFVLFDPEFWFSMWVSIKYAALYMAFGFVAPIVLAILLTEVPRGKILFRTIYYLPTVLAGVIVIFLWKGFYGQYGMINHLINFVIDLFNVLPGVALPHVHTQWLTSPGFALIACLLPSIWAGMGPGCLIYLAALKTVPEEQYEAADVDGAGVWHKTRHVAIPGIRGLIFINFIGALIGAVRSGSEFILAMTGGGPFNPYGQTEVVGLRIFMEAFAYLRFGAATAMAWIVGSLLVGFTVLQLQRLSQMEFKTVGTEA